MWIAELVDRFFAPIYAIGGKYNRSLDRLTKVNCYELKGTRIIKGSGRLRRSTVDVNSIKRWWSAPEMTFDIVLIELTDGSVIQWLDSYDDLLGILRRVAGDKWCE